MKTALLLSAVASAALALLLFQVDLMPIGFTTYTVGGVSITVNHYEVIPKAWFTTVAIGECLIGIAIGWWIWQRRKRG